jgi:hypothetical protein
MGGTVSDVLSVGGDPGLRAQMRGKVGFGGNVFKEDLAAGKYAILLPSPVGGQEPVAGVPPTSVAVLAVEP